MTARPAAGGGRWVAVSPERLSGWARGFAERHGAVEVAATPEVVRLAAADGAVAECHVSFPPLSFPGDTSPVAALVAHACRSRRVGVLLVRLGGYAAGVFEGERLVVSKVGSRLVHGRSAAGGWSQQRFARRREKQSSEAMRAAADVAARVLAPRAAELEAVVLGGDRRAIDELREDRRLAPVFALEGGPFLTVPDPRLAVLEGASAQFRAVRIRVIDPEV
ncbi:acVLRF1 family peptidyl-tRNA hydrolase [Planotetraspora sp. A-T 1434]|uniref:acVLRF1 family peptidyl-tRNA hydrolase n=1 Tax=Planotetraspora sp. A-T 1434 TaxID=2979219 RepID=UPI0021BFB0AA|nr:acVLRF1 family peptidyl-tRNA hydrolase [Planotetraspora sp. A-T 1434]MCT9932767.1 acVLRF1 family peptidyl-tRNA hydrolase [Planotetraspora sp. A-T 1434]